MFGNIRTPTALSAKKLDQYLERGWFRMGQALFTCYFLNFNRKFYSAIWLRIGLHGLVEERTFTKLKKQNSQFKIMIAPALINIEKEELYSKYKEGIRFETATSLQSLLLKAQSETIFNTYEVSIRDGNKLIGVGFFDLGEESAAGIVSFYDHAYKKNSLGKFIIYLKLEFCKKLGFTYFYPGYFAPRYPMFDYKLAIGTSTLQYYDPLHDRWEEYSDFSTYSIPIDETEQKLDAMESALREAGVDSIRMKYEYYNANNMLYLQRMNLFDYPEFLFVRSELYHDYAPVVVYDASTKTYMILKCISKYTDSSYESLDGYYGNHLMKVEQTIYEHSDERTFAAWFQAKV